MLAGAMTKSNVIGVIGGTELPPVRESFLAFSRGAKAVNPKVAVLTSYIGNWDDVSAGREQALAQIGRNADVIFQNADAAGLGVFRAARETKKALVVGSNSDQNSVAPEITIASVVIDLPHAFLTVAREVRARTFKPRVIKLGAESDVVTLVINPGLPLAHPARSDACRRFGARRPCRATLRSARSDTIAHARPRTSRRSLTSLDISTPCCARTRYPTIRAR